MSLEKLSDEDLIAKIQSNGGDNSAFNEIYRRYNSRFERAAYKIIKDSETSKDIVQDVFCRVHNSISRFNHNYKFSTWAYKILFNRALEYFRKNKKEPKFITEGNIYSSLTSKENTPEQELEAKEIQENIKSAIKDLWEDQRTCFILKYIHGRTYAQISKDLNLPLGTVKSRINRAKESIYRKLNLH